MKAKYKILLTEILTWLSFSCANNIETAYPTPIRINNRNMEKVEALDSGIFRILDNSKMKIFTIGDYVLFQSILLGPAGRASNYHHYLLVDKECSKRVYFMSLSSEINNIWTSNDTVFVDLLDFGEGEYEKGTWLDDGNHKYILYHLALSESSFTLDTIAKEDVFLKTDEIYSYLP